MTLKLFTRIFIALFLFQALFIINDVSAQESSENSSKVTFSGGGNIWLDTSFKESDQGALEGFSGDYRKGFPQFMLRSAYLVADADILPWLSANMEVSMNTDEVLGLDSASMTATLSPTLSVQAGLFNAGFDGITAGNLLNEVATAIDGEDDIMGVSINGSALGSLLQYKFFIANAYTGGIATKDTHLVPALPQVGVYFQYDFLQPWRTGEEQFYNDTNFSFSMYARYASKLISKSASLAEEEAAKALTAGDPNPEVKRNFFSVGFSLDAAISMFTIKLATRFQTAKTVDITDSSKNLDKKFIDLMGGVVDIATTLYNQDNFAVAGVVRLQFFNQTIEDDKMFEGDPAESVTRLSVGFPMYFYKDVLSVTPEIITDIARDIKDGTGSENKTKNMVFRLGSAFTF